MRVREILDTTLTALMALGALTVAVIWVRRETAKPPAVPAVVTQSENWGELSRDVLTSWGPSSAPVTIVAFSDFQCPYCKTFAERVAEISNEFPKDVRFIFRHLPITWSHPQAVPAALAAECASQQGKFRAFHDTLFANQASLPTRTWNQYAVAAGVPDTLSFSACMKAPETAQRLASDSLTADAEEVAGTPTVYLNGMRFGSPPSLTQLREQVKRAIDSSKTERGGSR